MAWEQFKAIVKGSKKEKLGPKVERYSFGKTPVLIVAPHIGGEKVKVTAEGKAVTFNMCEWATDVLAAVAAKDIGGQLMVSRIPRNKIDFARNPEELGKDVIARLGHSQLSAPVRVPVHSDLSGKKLLLNFHNKIAEISPKFILTYHGMMNKKYDVLFGFGRRKQYIGGLLNSYKFRAGIKAHLPKKSGLMLGISWKKLTGESDFILKSHVHRPVRGALVEFNKWGRNDKEPSSEYEQIAIAIARTAAKWVE
ncbi:MAG: hypothetical protein GOV00_03870 [Candidatus Altiarchaeota archaeon]|nr:hypothetical protein [Candidatus Altiarchaeota archaeon]